MTTETATMNKFKLRFLALKWSISKAQDTYGYNRLTLTDPVTGTRHVTCGGGYCMTSAVLASWANEHLRHRLDTITPVEAKGSRLYGFSAKGDTSHYGAARVKSYIDGGIGVSSVQNILKVIGIEVEEVYDRSKRNGKLIGFMVGEVEA